MDKADLKIVRELDRDARASFVKLGQALRMSPDTVRYRVGTLLERGLISRCYTVVDPGRLGYSVHKVLLKLHNVDEKRAKQLVEYLVNHPAVNWVARFDGIYDLGFTIWIGSLSELSDFIDGLKKRFFKFISRMVFAVNIEAEFCVRDYLLGVKRVGVESAKYAVKSTPIPIDDLDRHILQSLSEDPRIGASDIAKRSSLTGETVSKRITKLEKSGVISGYRVALNCAAAGVLNHYVFIHLHYVSAAKIKRFIDHCRLHPNVVYLIKALGEWDYELNIESFDMSSYRKLIMELTSEFSEIIRDYYSIPVNSVEKFTILPWAKENLKGTTLS